MAKEKQKTRCDKHPGRIAAVAVEVHNKLMCWECYLGRVPFEHRYGAGFYDQDDATWLIDNPENEPNANK